MHLTRCCLIALSLFLVTMEGQRAIGDDYFVTIGGGYSPSGNQVSLEKNVLFFQQLISENYVNGASHDIYFSDGDSPSRDLQYEIRGEALPRVNELLAEIHRDTKYLKHRYRDHEIENVQGQSSRANLSRWFEEQGQKLTASDRLFIYVTAHGGKSSDKRDPENTKLYMWNNESILMKEFVSQLDKVSPQVPVVMIMVQCYSGGFANVIFNQGNSGRGASEANRCGFFATVHDRVAAGCTPDVDEENYQEYSTHFWAAIGGKTRTGKSVASCDFNKDGHVSLDEAHAYSLIHSSTIDISIKSSDTFLRAFSELGDSEQPDLWSADSPISKLMAFATPSERVVIEELSRQLRLDDEERASETKRLASRLQGQKKDMGRSKQRSSSRYNRVCDEIKRSITRSWPELSNRWNPAATELMSVEGDLIVAAIENHPKYREFESLKRSVADQSEESFDLEKRWVKCQRLLRTLDNVAYAANLSKVASQEVNDRFAQLRASESASFGATPLGNAVAVD